MRNKYSKPPHKLRFAVIAADVVLFTFKDKNLLVRVAKVDRPPHFPNTKGFPGGLIAPKETAEETAKRLIKDKGMINPNNIYLEQLYTFSALERDPRGRVVALAHLALVPWDKLSASEREHSRDAWWSPVSEATRLAYDHDEILRVAIERLRSRVTYTTLIGKLMPDEFTLTELEHCYEGILKADLDKRNFRKKILKLGILTPVGKKKSGGRFRPAQLYRFTSKKVSEIEIL